MKKLFFAFCVLSILFVNCRSTGNAGNNNPGFNSEVHGELFIEKTAGFSMYIPKGWEIKNITENYLAAIGPVDNKSAPNIAFADEQYSGSISEYIDAVIVQFSEFYANFEVIENESFITNTGLQGRYIILLGQIDAIHVRQRLYVMQNQTETAVITIIGTASFADGEKYDALFDGCAKTFNWIK